jgi:hypothetical protein
VLAPDFETLLIVSTMRNSYIRTQYSAIRTFDGESVSWNSAKARRMSGLAWPTNTRVSRRRRAVSGGGGGCTSGSAVLPLAQGDEHVEGYATDVYSLRRDRACAVIAS